MDGNQVVDFYWIDPMVIAGHLYLQFELEESWDWHGVRALGRVDGGLVFEAAYILDQTSMMLKYPTAQCFLC